MGRRGSPSVIVISDTTVHDEVASDDDEIDSSREAARRAAARRQAERREAERRRVEAERREAERRKSQSWYERRRIERERREEEVLRRRREEMEREAREAMRAREEEDRRARLEREAEAQAQRERMRQRRADDMKLVNTWYRRCAPGPGEVPAAETLEALATLQLDPGQVADESELKRSFKQKIFKVHPDRCPPRNEDYSRWPDGLPKPVTKEWCEEAAKRLTSANDTVRSNCNI